MSNAWTTIPHVTQFDSADVTRLETFRKQYGPRAEMIGGRMTVLSLLLPVLTAALKRFPRFNASVDMENQEFILKKYINIGVAVDTENGLLVPVVRDVDKKNILDICVEVPQLAEKARARKLTLEEMSGGTFTVTNLGGIGGTGFTPIINAPEVAVLGISRSRVEPVFLNGGFAPRTMLPLSLSYDHRVIDGADAARFLRWVAEALEQPFVLLLDETEAK
jgi:pyruvate dehydrogenase E2 component (dihydrolipoamide acetyltransferase)